MQSSGQRPNNPLYDFGDFVFFKDSDICGVIVSPDTFEKESGTSLAKMVIGERLRSGEAHAVCVHITSGFKDYYCTPPIENLHIYRNNLFKA